LYTREVEDKNVKAYTQVTKVPDLHSEWGGQDEKGVPMQTNEQILAQEMPPKFKENEWVILWFSDEINPCMNITIFQIDEVFPSTGKRPHLYRRDGDVYPEDVLISFADLSVKLAAGLSPQRPVKSRRDVMVPVV
jgi:hypothetical protein